MKTSYGLTLMGALLANHAIAGTIIIGDETFADATSIDFGNSGIYSRSNGSELSLGAHGLAFNSYTVNISGYGGVFINSSELPGVLINSGGNIRIQTERPDPSSPAGPGNEPGDVIVNATKLQINADTDVLGNLTVDGERVATVTHAAILRLGNSSISDGGGDPYGEPYRIISMGNGSTLGSHLSDAMILGSNNYAAFGGNINITGYNNRSDYSEESSIIGKNNTVAFGSQRTLTVGKENNNIGSWDQTLLGVGLYAYNKRVPGAIVGKYNINKPSTVFTVGNGTSSERSNALEVHEDGKVVMTGDVVLDKVQGDVSMGIFGQ